MTNHPYYLMREVERIRGDVQEIIDHTHNVNGGDANAALLKVCGRLRGVEDHLSDKAFEAETRSVLADDLPPIAEPTSNLVYEVAMLSARDRSHIYELLFTGYNCCLEFNREGLHA